MSRHNDKNIKEVLGQFLTTNKRISTGYYTSRIEEIWKNEMGSVINGYTSRITLYNGELKVYLTSSALKKELSMSKDKVIKLLNDAVGNELIKSVKFY